MMACTNLTGVEVTSAQLANSTTHDGGWSQGPRMPDGEYLQIKWQDSGHAGAGIKTACCHLGGGRVGEQLIKRFADITKVRVKCMAKY